MPILERRALLAAMGEAWPQLAPSDLTMTAAIAVNDDTAGGIATFDDDGFQHRQE